MKKKKKVSYLDFSKKNMGEGDQNFFHTPSLPYSSEDNLKKTKQSMLNVHSLWEQNICKNIYDHNQQVFE